MFVIELSYKVALEQVDAYMKKHVLFLNKYYNKGNFIVSGRKIPRTGGIIIAVGNDKKFIEKIIKEDPFHKNKLAEYNIIEFNASQKAKNINELIV
ncbi:MAG: YciI family protein [Chitinophagaceae bacterium]